MEDIKTISDTLSSLVGDTPVSVQLEAALECMALKDHEHSNYADRNEIEDLKRKIEMLIDLVGDMPVSEQISNAIELNKN